jgi:hypothetical protein
MSQAILWDPDEIFLYRWLGCVNSSCVNYAVSLFPLRAVAALSS